MDALRKALVTTTDLLDQAGMPYAVTGSFAAAQHGYVRATEDVDVKVVVGNVDELEALADRLPPGVQRIDATTWRFGERVDVEFYPVRDALDHAAVNGRVLQRLNGETPREIWVVPLEALMVLKLREHVRHGHGLKHIADIQALLARNVDTLDVKELERLLALDPAWGKAWDSLVEPG